MSEVAASDVLPQGGPDTRKAASRGVASAPSLTSHSEVWSAAPSKDASIWGSTRSYLVSDVEAPHSEGVKSKKMTAIEPHTLNTGPDTPTLGASRRRLGPVLINPKPGMPNSINMPAPGSATAAAAESVSSPTSQMSETRSTLSAHGMTMNRVSLGTSSNGQAGGGSGSPNSVTNGATLRAPSPAHRAPSPARGTPTAIVSINPNNPASVIARKAPANHYPRNPPTIGTNGKTSPPVGSPDSGSLADSASGVTSVATDASNTKDSDPRRVFWSQFVRKSSDVVRKSSEIVRASRDWRKRGSSMPPR
eukprot:jgi/Chrzof1/1968/Cz10g28090.t1